MFILIDKPKGITSHDVIDRLRKITGIRKIGHAGTLDPNATGLLIVGIGRDSTKRLGDISKNTNKTYVSEVYLGEERDTDDVEGKLRDSKTEQDGKLTSEKLEVTRDDVEDVLNSFLGEQKQTPPAYSAIKLQGKKAYELARKGQKVSLKARNITIYSIKLLGYIYPILEFEVEVSSGTYIRSIARDLGRKVGGGAYLKNLRRTKIGKCSIDRAINLEKITEVNWKKYCLMPQEELKFLEQKELNQR